MSSNEYYRPTKWDIEQLTFEKDGSRYSGPAIVLWNPEDGATVHACVRRTERTGHDRSGVRTIKMGPWVSPYTTFHGRLKFSTERVILFQAVPHFAPFDDLDGSPFWLTLTPLRIVFCGPITKSIQRTNCRGEGLIVNQSRLLLPTWVETKSIAEGQVVDHRHHRMYHRNLDGDFIDIREERKGEWAVVWSPPISNTRSDLYRFGVAIMDAITLETSEPTVTLLSSLLCGRRHRVEYRKRPRITATIAEGLLPDSGFFKEERFLGVLQFLNARTHEAFVAHRLINSTIEAFQLPRGYAQDLSLATAFEASLRTLEYNTGRHWGPQNPMGRFCKKYQLGRPWRDAIDKGIDAWERLRHRNAHPDWLSTEAGAESHDAAAQAMDDRNYLMRLYGYMVLAMAAVPMGDPQFPKPVDRPWRREVTTLASQ